MITKNEKTKQLSELEERLKKAEEEGTIEKHLKNEAYAFLLAEGLLDKFLEFRQHFHRSRAQDALYNLVFEASLGGLWVDI